MLTINRYLCAYCGGCVGVCPTLALVLDELTLNVDQEKCPACGICVKLCPVGALSLPEQVAATD